MPKRRITRYRAAGIAVMSLIIALSLNGCGGSTEKPAVVPPSLAATSKAPEPISAPAESTPEAPVQSADAPPTEDPPADSGEAPTSGPVLPSDSTGRTLTLADFFQPDPIWNGNRFDVADRRQLQGIGTDIVACNRDQGAKLELRLANNFKTLQFNVGQANNSAMSDQRLIVEVVGNNSQIDIRRIPFNVVQKISVPVSGVNALQVYFYLDDKVQSCGSGAVSAVLFDVTLG